MDDTICHFIEASDKAKLENPKQPFPQAQWGFFLGLSPIEGAVDNILKLSRDFDIWFLTRPSTRNINCYSEKAQWILNHFGQWGVDRLIICPNKSLVKGEFLIDDQGGFGQEEFEGTWIKFGDDIKDWYTLYDYLISLK